MKRKIFSKLLMVALVIAAVGSFVSCKDYDDDINNLQKQIDAKAALSELTALQSTLDSKIAAAQSAAAAAQATADAAATKTALADLKSALETAIADAKKAGTDAGTQAGEAIAAANKAAQAAEDAAKAAKEADAAAKAELEAEIEKAKTAFTEALGKKADAAETADAIAAVKAIADAAYTKTEAETLQKSVSDLKTELETLQTSLEADIDKKIDDKIKEVNNAVASVDAIWGAITSVELYASNKSLTGADNVDELYFLKGTEVTNSFGAAVIPAGNAALPYDGHEISEIKNYKAGDPIKFDNRIIVRVNPANATFTADDVVLIDSKGNSLNDLVDVAVEPYTQLLTRGDFNSGLYVISFTRKGTATEADFAEATEGEVYDAEKKPMLCEGAALYAIGINNSKDAAEKRYVNTAFNIGVNYGDYERQNDFSFVVRDIVGDKDIADLHNRWKVTDDKLVGEDKTAEKVVPGKWNADLVWAAKSDDNATAFANHVDTASVSGQKEAKYRNWAYGDYRYANDTYVVVDKDKRTFTIMGIDAVNKGFIGADLNLVQYYYVTLDRYAAVESAPSEWESWNSYSYTGLYTVTPAIDNLRITIDSEEAVGDIIGFRVFAVNYDGSLADPDGMAFYVQVGKPEAAKDKSFNAYWTANVQTTTVATLANASAENKAKTGLFNTGVTDISAAVAAANFKDIALTAAQKAGTATFSSDDYANDIAKTGAGAAAVATTITVNWALLKSVEADGTFTATNYASKWSEIKYVALGVNDPGHVLDGATATDNLRAGSLPLTFEGKDADHHDKVVNKMTINVIKQLPSTPSGFAWRSTYAPNGTTWTIYPEPSAWKRYSDDAVFAWGTAYNVAGAAGKLYSPMSTFATGYDATYGWNFYTKSDRETAATGVSYVTGTQSILIDGDKVGDPEGKANKFYGVLAKTIDDVRCTAASATAAPTALVDYACEIFAGNVIFESAINKYSYSLVPYTYFSAWPAAATAGTSATSTKVAVVFNNGAAQDMNRYNLGFSGANTKYAYNAAAVKMKLSDLIKASNSAISTLTGGFALGKYTNVAAKVTNAAGVEDLIAAQAAVAADQITFTGLATAVAPLTQVEETVTLTMTDAFGNETQTSFPIIILPAALESGFVE